MFARGNTSEVSRRPVPADPRPLEAWERAAGQSNQRWLKLRRQRIEAHAQRVGAYFCTLSGHPGSFAGRCTHGRRRMVWCVELGRAFGSLTEAAAFVDRQPCNILQAINLSVRCGPYRWESFDPLRHGPAPAPASEWRNQRPSPITLHSQEK